MSRRVVFLNLGDLDSAVVARFPDGSEIRLPYSNLKEALYNLLASLHQNRYTVILERPMIVLARNQSEAKERLLLAQLIREIIKELGIDYVEVEGLKVKYSHSQPDIVIYTETTEDYNNFKKIRNKLLLEYLDILALNPPEVVFIPVTVAITNDSELYRLRECIKSKAIGLELGEAVLRAVKDYGLKTTIVGWLYSMDDLSDSEKIDQLASIMTREKLGETIEKKLKLSKNVYFLYHPSGKIPGIPSPNLKVQADFDEQIYVENLLLPVIIDASDGAEEFYETFYLRPPPHNILAEIGLILKRVYKLNKTPIVHAPLLREDVVSYLAVSCYALNPF